MIRRIPILLAGLLAPIAFAHHSITAHYDLGRRVSVEGVVSEFSYSNPHALVYVEAVSTTEEQGEIWVLQWQNTLVMARRGYTPQTLRPGDRIIASGNPARNGTNWMRLLSLSRPADGFEYQASREEQFLLIPGQ